MANYPLTLLISYVLLHSGSQRPATSDPQHRKQRSSFLTLAPTPAAPSERKQANRNPQHNPPTPGIHVTQHYTTAQQRHRTHDTPPPTSAHRVRSCRLPVDGVASRSAWYNFVAENLLLWIGIVGL